MHFFCDYYVSLVLESSCILYTLRFSALAPCVALGLRSRLGSTDYIHVIVPPASMQSCARCFLVLTEKLLFLKAF